MMVLLGFYTTQPGEPSFFWSLKGRVYCRILMNTTPHVKRPLKSRSLRVISESFRYMVKHIQTFSGSKIFPAYSQQGATSLTR